MALIIKVNHPLWKILTSLLSFLFRISINNEGEQRNIGLTAFDG
jgi:hypothetical protein